MVSAGLRVFCGRGGRMEDGRTRDLSKDRDRVLACWMRARTAGGDHRGQWRNQFFWRSDMNISDYLVCGEKQKTDTCNNG